MSELTVHHGDCEYCEAATTNYLCGTCLDLIQQRLQQTPETIRQLNITVTKQDKTGTGVGRRSTEQPMMFNILASAARTSLKEAARWASSKPLTGWAKDPHAAEMLYELDHTHKEAWRIMDTQEEYRRAGDCPSCGKTIMVTDDQPFIVCECTHFIDVKALRAAQRQKALEHLGGHVATPTQLSRIFSALGTSVTADRIWRWANRGKIVSARTNKKGKPEYLLTDVLDKVSTH